MPAAKLRSAELQRPHLALMSLSGVGGGGRGEQVTLNISRIRWGLKLSTLVRERAFFR